jgi:hypothetical protein
MGRFRSLSSQSRAVYEHERTLAPFVVEVPDVRGCATVTIRGFLPRSFAT